MTERALSVVAVVTMFRPAEIPPLLESIAPQVDGIIVVDDGSGPRFARVRDRVRTSGATLVELEHNAGIAAALNVGIERARELGADAVITFDQDSTVDPDFVAMLLDAHENAKARGPVGPVVPAYFGDIFQGGLMTDAGVQLAAHAIQSGMLVPIEVLDVVGDMDEELFIDLVDTDFELRCADAGLACIIAPELRLRHRLGARYRMRGPLGRLLPPLMLSTPFRYYYRSRNRVIINRRYPGHRRRLFVDGLADRAYFLIAVLLARPRRAMLRLLREGRRAGRADSGGPMPEPLQSMASEITWRAERLPD